MAFLLQTFKQSCVLTHTSHGHMCSSWPVTRQVHSW